jgi:hypothetical protein
MTSMPDRSAYRIFIDKEWGLNDLSGFSHDLGKAYAFTYCFESVLAPQDAARIDEALITYPWGGGYSIVNIYIVLQRQVPPQYRPQINSIRYASPGWIELLLSLEAVAPVATAVAAIGGSAIPILGIYSAIQKMLHNISVQKKKFELDTLRLHRRQASELRGLCNELSKSLGFKNFDEFLARTGRNEEIAAKLLSAQFRLLKNIAEYSKTGQLTLPPVPPK